VQLGSHPVAVVQYTFAHKQYTENTIWEGCGPCTVFASFTLAFCLTTEEKAMEKPQSV